MNPVLCEAIYGCVTDYLDITCGQLGCDPDECDGPEVCWEAPHVPPTGH